MEHLSIISGGQTGVDRAALDVAQQLGLPRGGWCPKGRWSEQGVIDSSYPLTETPSADPAQRTEWNVRDADATLILSAAPLTGGTALTRDLARRLDKPFLVVDPALDPDQRTAAAESIEQWLGRLDVRTLNSAGPRESGSPGIYDHAALLLRVVFKSQRRSDEAT